MSGLVAGCKAPVRSKVGTLQARATPQTAPRPGNPKGRSSPTRHSSLRSWRVHMHTRRRAPRLARRQGPSRPRNEGQQALTTPPKTVAAHAPPTASRALQKQAMPHRCNGCKHLQHAGPIAHGVIAPKITQVLARRGRAHRHSNQRKIIMATAKKTPAPAKKAAVKAAAPAAKKAAPAAKKAAPAAKKAAAPAAKPVAAAAVRRRRGHRRAGKPVPAQGVLPARYALLRREL